MKAKTRSYKIVDNLAVESVNKSDSHIIRREFLTQTFSGFLRVIYQSLNRLELQSGFLQFPDRLFRLIDWLPTHEANINSRFLVYDANTNGNWKAEENLTKNWNFIGREVLFCFYGKKGAFLLSAKRKRASSPSPIFADEAWEVYLVWDTPTIIAFLHRVESSWKSHSVLRNLRNTLVSGIQNIKSSAKVDDSIDIELQTAVRLSTDMDEWTRKHSAETKWSNVLMRIQDAVAWELRSDRLLQSIGSVLRSTLGYDYIDIHIFRRVGKRYEAFISWRRNYTGFGDDQMALLLSEELVTTVLRSHQPKALSLSHKNGLMNPHLAKLANLDTGLIVPLLKGNTVEGMVTLAYKKKLELSSIDLDRISKIGKVIAKSVATSNAHTQVHRMATVDGLTNVYNRRFFNEQLLKEMKRAKRYNHNIAMIMIDIDYFKKYNDSHGHLMGDRILKQFAEVLRSSVRDDDLVARYGGEEFAVVLPYSDVRKGHFVAEKIRREVLLTKFPAGEQQPLGKLTISLGVADNLNNVTTSQEMINNADLALYKAKAQGRNQTVIYSPDLDS